MCPVCKQAMVVLDVDGIEIDHCAMCLGTWLDTGELEQIVERTGGRSGLVCTWTAAVIAGVRGRRRCPRCRRRMRTSRFADCVEVDGCPAGHGWWFDAGEIQILVEACGGASPGPVARFFGDLYAGSLKSDSKGG